MRVVSKIRSITAEMVPAPERLNSWKEIAGYLDRDPRTVQLWEKNESLPVHRIAHQARSTVYAHRAEIDAWLKTRSGKAAIGSPLAPVAAPVPSSRRFPLYLLSSAVLVMIVCAVVGLSAWRRSQHPAAGSASVAVLPFENQTSPDDPLADGLTEDVISDLGQSGQLTVISHRFSRGYRGRHLPLAQLAAELHAPTILRGVVAQVNDRVIVTVELVDAAHEAHLWGKTYTYKTADALPSEDDLAAGIAEAVTKRLIGSAARPRNESRSADPQAMHDYLTGRYYWNQRDLAGLQKAIASYQEAIAIDPRFAAAYAGLAGCYDLMTDRGVMSNDEAFRLAKLNAHAALDRDPNSAEALTALAFATYRQDWDFAKADSYFRQAIRANPGYSVAHQWYGEFLGDLRRFDQSIAELRKSKELDPLSPMAGADLADGYMHAGRNAEAEEELKRVLDMYPDFVPGHQYLVGVYVSTSNLAAAQAEAQIYANLTGDRSSLDGLQIRRLLSAGEIQQARNAVRRILADKQHPLDPFKAAQLYFVTGQTELGYGTLEQAYREHSWWLVTMLVDPGFIEVRDQSRFLSLAQRVGLPGTEVPAAPPARQSAIP